MGSEGAEARGSEGEGGGAGIEVDAASFRSADATLDGEEPGHPRRDVSPLARLDRFVAHEYSLPDASMGVFRVAFAFAILLHIPAPTWVARVPPAIFLPHLGPMQLMSGPPSSFAIDVLHGAAITAALLLASGIAAAPAALVLSAAVMVLQGLRYSVENVHHHIVLPLVPALLAFSGWNRRFVLLPKRFRDSTSGERATAVGLALLAIAIGFVFFTATMPKLMGGWLDPSTPAAYAHVVSRAKAGQNVGMLASLAYATAGVPFWELLDWFTVLVEGAVLFLVPWRRAFVAMLAVLVYLHLGIYLFMGTNFSGQVLAYAAFVDWKRVWDVSLGRSELRIAGTLAVAACAACGLVIGFIRSPAVGILSFAGALATAYLSLEASRLVTALRRRALTRA